MKHTVEAFDIWQYLCGKSYNYEPLIRCRIDFEGQIDVDALKHSITLSLQTIPFIGCCFVGQSCRPRWIDKGFSGEDVVRVIGAGQDTKNQILRHFSDKIDFSAEPQLKITVVRRPGGDTLCIIISHIVCDAAGFKQYLYLLSQFYTKLKKKEKLPEQIYYQRGTKPLFTDTNLKEKIRILRSRMSDYVSSANQEQHGIDFQSGEPVVCMERRIIPREHFESFKAYTKINSATVNDGLMALFARTFCKNTDTERILMPSTMDLRKFIPETEKYGITNYSSGCMCNISVNQDDTLAETVAQVSKQMQAYKSGKNILKSVLMWSFAARAIPYPLLKRLYPKINKQPIISYTNLGVIDTGLLNFGDLPSEKHI